MGSDGHQLHSESSATCDPEKSEERGTENDPEGQTGGGVQAYRFNKE